MNHQTNPDPTRDAYEAGRRAVLEHVARIMNESTSRDGWDIGILDDLDRYLSANGIEYVDCETLP